MNRYDCILLNMSRSSEWRRGVVNRNFYIAKEIERSPLIRKVLSVDLLPHTFRRAVKMWAQDIHRPSLSRLTATQAVTHYRLTTIVPLVNEGRFVRQLMNIARHLGFETTILWSYLPTFVRVFDASSNAIKVFDAVDDWSAHPAYRGMVNRLQTNYETIKKRADVIFTVSQQLRAKFNGHPRTFWVPNGIDPERFMLPRTKPGRPLLIYVGVIQERVDLELLEHLARARPEYDLQLVGLVWKGIDVRRLSRLPNVTLTGFVPAADVPPLLTRATVGLVPHRQGELVASMNPMKVYEYLAAGLSVVSTPIADFEAFSSVVAVAATRAQFIEAVDAAVAAPPDPERTRQLVVSQTWSSRFVEMWRHIDEFLRNASRPNGNQIH